MALDEVNDLLRAQLPEGDWDTIGGLLLAKLGHVPVEGESVEVDGWRAHGPAGRRPPHRTRPHPSPPRLRSVAGRDVRGVMRSGFVTLRRTPERGEVDPREPHRRHQGGDHLGQAPDDAHPHHGRAEPTRRAGRVRRHARDPQAAHATRAAASTPPPRAPSATSTSCASCSTPPSRWAAATSGSRAWCRATRCASSTRSTGRRSRRSSISSRAASGLELSEYFPVSARTGDGVDALVEHLVGRLPEGPAVLPRRHGHRRAGGVLGGGARPRAAAAPHPRRAAALHRRPGHRVGLAVHPLRDPRGARAARRGS